MCEFGGGTQILEGGLDMQQQLWGTQTVVRSSGGGGGVGAQHNSPTP